MEKVTALEIQLLYSSSTGEFTFYKIRNGNATFDFYEDCVKNFWNISGGIELLINGTYSVYRSVDFEYLAKPVDFLLESLRMIYGFEHNFSFVTYRSDIVYLRPMGYSKLELFIQKDVVLLSNNSLGPAYQSSYRNSRLFSQITIDKKMWVDQVCLALEDYFYFLEYYITNSDIEITEDFYLKELQYWNYIKKYIGWTPPQDIL